MLLTKQKNQRYIAIWLLLCAIAIFSMIVLGGVTRLTRSGLSIVEWRPITGIIPPLTDSAWIEEFEKYQSYPEYQKINNHMTLGDFKFIFYFEYAHRLLGRFIGLFFLIPFLYFYFRHRIPKPLALQLLGIFALGSLQGLLGWYMVKSGLVNEPRVSQYRLTAHLGMAVIIYAYILWLAFRLLFHKQGYYKPASTYRYAQAFTLLIFIMILSGGLVAGTRAGLIYNTFPLMNGSIIPQGLFVLQPLWLNFFENLTNIQFNHRVLAYLIAITGLVLSLLVLGKHTQTEIKRATCLLLFMLSVQIPLGILTLLYQVPVVLGVAHQACAILLFSAALFTTYQLKHSPCCTRTVKTARI